MLCEKLYIVEIVRTSKIPVAWDPSGVAMCLNFGKWRADGSS